MEETKPVNSVSETSINPETAGNNNNLMMAIGAVVVIVVIIVIFMMSKNRSIKTNPDIIGEIGITPGVTTTLQVTPVITGSAINNPTPVASQSTDIDAILKEIDSSRATTQDLETGVEADLGL